MAYLDDPLRIDRRGTLVHSDRRRLAKLLQSYLSHPGELEAIATPAHKELETNPR